MIDEATVWIVDDDKSIRWVLEKAIQAEGIELTSFDNGQTVLDALQSSVPDVLVSDIRMPGIDGLALMESIKKQCPELPIIIMTAYSDLDSAVSVYEGGAFEYLPKPFDIDDAVELVKRALNLKHERAKADTAHFSAGLEQEIIGEAPAMQQVFRAIGRLAKSNITVLINGESGTGKELVAHALHKHSPRNEAPFIALNMAAIPKELMESELFGHEKGAFTGATSTRLGRFEQADGGSLFLDEIGDMPIDLQTRLLRVLANGEFFRVGGHTPIKVDVRIITATHQDLQRRVDSGQFREDLFHRLNVIRIQIPALNDRKEDIPELANHFLLNIAKELDVAPKMLSKDVKKYLKQLDWPGNVRQLENVCRWLTVMSPSQQIHKEDLPDDLISSRAKSVVVQDWQSALFDAATEQAKSGQENALADMFDEVEQTLISVALELTDGKRQEAAKLLGWGRNTLTRKLKKQDE